VAAAPQPPAAPAAKKKPKLSLAFRYSQDLNAQAFRAMASAAQSNSPIDVVADDHSEDSTVRAKALPKKKSE
jgi:hypothetical protein